MSDYPDDADLAAMASLATMAGLLKEAADMIRACNGWHMSTAEPLADRIDHALSTTKHGNE